MTTPLPGSPGTVEHAHPSLDLTLGAIEIGVLLSTLLYGTALVQAYFYASNYSRDRRWMQAIVATVMSLETAHTVCMWAYLYHLTVTSFGNPAAANGLPWSLNLTIPLQTIASSIVQAFFSYRVQVLSGRWWLAAPAYVAQAFRACIGIAVCVLCFQSKELNVFRGLYGYVVDMSLILSVITDLWNTTLLCTFLRDKQTDYAGMKSAINRIMLWTIETGIMTTIFAVLIVTFFMAMPSNGIWVCFYLIYPKMYPNSLLVSLNSRGKLQAHLQSSGAMRTPTYEISVQHHVQSSSRRTGTAVDAENGEAVGLQVLRADAPTGYAFEDYK